MTLCCKVIRSFHSSQPGQESEVIMGGFCQEWGRGTRWNFLKVIQFSLKLTRGYLTTTTCEELTLLHGFVHMHLSGLVVSSSYSRITTLVAVSADFLAYWNDGSTAWNFLWGSTRRHSSSFCPVPHDWSVPFESISFFFLFVCFF